MERWRRGVVLEMDNELGPRVKTDELHGVYHFNWIRSVGSLAYEQEMEDLWEEAYDEMDDYDAEEEVVTPEYEAAIARVEASEENKLYDELFLPWGSDSGRQASFQDQNRSEGDDTLTYGEILYTTFVVTILEKVRALGCLGPHSKVFTDVGAGTAKPCFAAALFHPFQVCRGIEVLGTLCTLAEEIAQAYRTKIQPRIGESAADGRRQTAIEIVKQDAFASECDHIG